MKASAFLDTNVILRHLLQDDPIQSPQATAFLVKVETGAVVVATSDTVLFETVFLLERRYRHPKAQIRAVLLPEKRYLDKRFGLYVDLGLPFADAHHVVLMERLHLKQIASFDTDFVKVPGITPPEAVMALCASAPALACRLRRVLSPVCWARLRRDRNRPRPPDLSTAQAPLWRPHQPHP